MINYFFLILLLFCSKLSYSEASDSIRIQRYFSRKSELTYGILQQFGVKKKNIKEFEIKDGTFSFTLPSSIEPGIYRLRFDLSDERPFVDLIINGVENNIVFDVELNILNATPLFYNPKENLNWYSYIEKSKNKIRRLDVLFNYLSVYYDSENNSDKSIRRIYQKERRQYYKIFDDFVKANSNNWCGLLDANRPCYYSNLREKPI